MYRVEDSGQFYAQCRLCPDGQSCQEWETLPVTLPSGVSGGSRSTESTLNEDTGSRPTEATLDEETISPPRTDVMTR